MSTGFVQFTPEDLVRTSDAALFEIVDTSAAFEERARRFNDRAGRTHTGDKEPLQKLRFQLAFGIAFRHELFVEQFRHFLPKVVDGVENEHHIGGTQDAYVDGLRESFHLALTFNLSRDHMIKACINMGARPFLTPELFTTVGSLDSCKGISKGHTTKAGYARAQANRISDLFALYSDSEQFEPDPETVKITEDPEIGPIILGAGFKPSDFVGMARSISLYATSGQKHDCDW